MNKERLMKILLRPIASEKTARIADKYNQIAFEVIRDATKPEIKKAVEELFSVKVKHVQVANVKGKTKMFQNRPGRRRHWKKAYVGLHEGHDISFAGD